MVKTLTPSEVRAHFRAAQRDGIPFIPECEALRQSWDRFVCGGLSTLEKRKRLPRSGKPLSDMRGDQ